jgi:hypothetical protein
MVEIIKVVDFTYQWETVQQGVLIVEATQFHIYNVILHAYVLLFV